MNCAKISSLRSILFSFVIFSMLLLTLVCCDPGLVISASASKTAAKMVEYHVVGEDCYA